MVADQEGTKLLSLCERKTSLIAGRTKYHHILRGAKRKKKEKKQGVTGVET
jgi:hypothetical protein